MAEQHYFLFSTGDYDDYVVTGLYCCDHEVNLEEWQEFKENYEKNWKRVREDSYIAYGKRTGLGHKEIKVEYKGGVESEVRIAPASLKYYSSPECLGCDEWGQENNPLEAFKKLHGMVQIPHSEIFY